MLTNFKTSSHELSSYVFVWPGEWYVWPLCPHLHCPTLRLLINTQQTSLTVVFPTAVKFPDIPMLSRQSTEFRQSNLNEKSELPRRNSLWKCVSQPEIVKNSLKPPMYFGGSVSFKVIDVGTTGKLVSSACYDKQ